MRHGPPIERRELRIEVPEEDVVMALRTLSGAERLRIASGMFSAAKRMLQSDLAARYPEWDEPRVQAEAARRLSLGAG